MLKWISQLGAKTFCHIKVHGPQEEHYQKQATSGVQTLALLLPYEFKIAKFKPPWPTGMIFQWGPNTGKILHIAIAL